MSDASDLGLRLADELSGHVAVWALELRERMLAGDDVRDAGAMLAGVLRAAAVAFDTNRGAHDSIEGLNEAETLMLHAIIGATLKRLAVRFHAEGRPIADVPRAVAAYLRGEADTIDPPTA